jgi:hypothetical protein
MAKGPLAVRWVDWTLARPEAGTFTVLHVVLENEGSATWGDTILLAYHLGRHDPARLPLARPP